MKFFINLKKTISIAFAVIMLLILFDVLVVQNFVDQFAKKNFPLPNFCLLLIGGAFVVLLSFAGVQCYNRFRARLDLWICRKTVIVCSVLLFALQLFIAYHIYFLTGWDAGLIGGNAMHLANGVPLDMAYYSQYPNNIFLTFVYAFILKINQLITVEASFFSIVIVQCLLSAVVAYLVYSVTFEFTKNKPLSFFAFLLYAIFVGLSPWFVIPYSDASGILFPLAIFKLWQMAHSAASKYKGYILYALMGLLAFVGYKIKPQIAIVFIAVVLICIIKAFFVSVKEKRVLFALSKISVSVLAFLIGTVGFSLILNANDIFQLDSEREFGIPHFLMMGLNEESQGVWNENDVAYSASFATTEERNAANLEVVKQRIEQYGFVGMTEHIAKKTLVNFGDGTFAWEVEGNFYQTVYPPKDEIISPFLQSFYYSSGENYSWFLASSQTIWLISLFLSLFAILYIWKHNSKGTELAVLLLSLLGLILFETLFEARARYLFTYVPIFIICAVIGLYMILKIVKAKGEKT